MTDLIALICPALLESRGSGHVAPYVVCLDPTQAVWCAANELGEPEHYRYHIHASPLWIAGAPCEPAIDAAVTAAEVAADWQQPANRWDHWRRTAKRSRAGCLDFAREAARLLSATLINQEPG